MAPHSAELAAAITAARDLLDSLGLDKAPIEIEDVARAVGVRSITPMSITADGYLGRSAAGELVIRYQSGGSRERRRFTIAHEVGHVLLARLRGVDISDPVFRIQSVRQAEEAMANRVAAELLLPENLLRSKLNQLAPSWNAIAAIRREFAVSTEALVQRILEIKGITGVHFRITPGATPEATRVLCRTSIAPPLLFRRPIQSEGLHLLESANALGCALLEAYVRDVPRIIQCAVKWMDKFAPPQYWLIGWVADPHE